MKKVLIVCCLALFTMATRPSSAQAAASATPPAHKIRVLILTGSSDWSHPWQGTAPFMQGILMNTGRFDVKLEEEVVGITAATLANYDVLVDYYYGPRWGEVTEHAVEDFVRSGKGMVGVHGITYGPFFGQAGGSATEPRRLEGEPWAAFSDMIGMTWKLENIGHAKRHIFVVEWVDRDHPISRGLPPTFVANDELYHLIDLKPNAHVLASAFDDPNNPGRDRKGATGDLDGSFRSRESGDDRSWPRPAGHESTGVHGRVRTQRGMGGHRDRGAGR